MAGLSWIYTTKYYYSRWNKAFKHVFNIGVNNQDSFLNNLSAQDDAFKRFNKRQWGYKGVSFAQVWANMTGGLVTAATEKNNDTGRTNYQYIYSKGSTDNWGWVNSALDFFSGTRSDRSDSRADYRFSTSGCLNYPIVDDGGAFKKFYAQ